MSSTRSDPEGDWQGCIPRYLPASVFGGAEAPEAVGALRAVSSGTASSVEQPVDASPLATYEVTQAGLRAARGALVAAQVRITDRW